MADNVNYIELVRQAQLGRRESMDSLVLLATGRMRACIFRLTLDHHLTEDLLQETLLEMVKSLKRLEKPERFWCWLYRTAVGKAQHHFRNAPQGRLVQMSTIDMEDSLQRSSGDHSCGLKNLISRELSETIFQALRKLSRQERNVLVLRCFEQMSYSEISRIMDCSQLYARVLFF